MMQATEMIVLCAVLSGVEDGVGMEAFAEEKEAWLRGFLDLPNGIPSHDTLSAVHRVSAFAGQARWVLAQQAVAEKSNEITAIPDLLALLRPAGGRSVRRCDGLPESHRATDCRGWG
jgi:hypothetical protein